MSVRFRHSLGDLEAAFVEARRDFRTPASRAVRQVASGGHMTARRLSRRRAGPHGKTFYKRVTVERVAPLTYEYGPEGVPKSEFVGVGYRNGAGNLDMAQSSDGLAGELQKRLRLVVRGTLRL